VIEQKDYAIIPDKTAPGPVSNVSYTPSPGGATFHYTLPTDEDLMCVKAVYTDDNGTACEVRASWYVETLTVTGFGKISEKKIQLISVDNSNNESAPVEVIITPGEPEIFAIAESVLMEPYWGGVQLYWDNPSRKDIAVELFMKDFNDKYVPLDAFYSSAETGRGTNVSGLESVPTDFAIYVKDRWGNRSPVKYFRATPDPFLMVPNLAGKNGLLVKQFNEDTRLKTLSRFTFETWIKVNKFSTVAPYISGVMGAEVESKCALIRIGNGSLANNNNINVGGFPDFMVNDPLVENVWYHFALTYDATTVKFYINGNVVGSRDRPGTILDLSMWNANDGAFAIGQSLGSRYLDGEMRETRVWTIARTMDEIRNYSCDVDPSSPGLVAYWKLDDGEGNILKDYSLNKYDLEAPSTLSWLLVPGCGYQE
jgi:hypothetical protein